MDGHVIEGFGIVGKDFGEPWNILSCHEKKDKENENGNDDNERWLYDAKEKEEEDEETHCANIVQ